MIIDIHTHLYPASIRQNRQAYFAGEPAFQLLYDSPKAKMAGQDDLLAVMDAQGIDKAVIFGFPWRRMAAAQLNNDAVAEAVARHPDRFIGFCCLDPAHPRALAEVERCLGNGLAGIGELAFYEGGISAAALAALDPIMALAKQRSLPVLIHTNEPVGHAYPGKSPNTLAQIYAMVRRYPDNTIILAHWGGGLFFYALLKKEISGALANVYVDTAASPYLYQPAVYRHAVEIFGADRVVFGSDFPLLEPRRYFVELEQSGLPQDSIALIRGGNAARVLGLVRRDW
jgi:hypothetical protein